MYGIHSASAVYPSVGSREFKKELLIGLTDIRIERQDAINFYKQLQMFPAEFVELRQKLCELGEASANAVNALDGAWHMQLGVPVLSRYFETNGIALPAPYEFYDTLREHMNNNSPTFAEAISFIGTVYAGYEIRAPEEIACRAFLISNILNDLKYSMSDNDVYELLVLFVKNGDHDCISMLIRCGRVIRDISAEKIIELLECLEKGEHAKFIPIWATWLMVGAGRKFAPEDMQAIRSCIDNIHAKYAELKHADEYMDELAITIKNNERGRYTEARAYLASYAKCRKKKEFSKNLAKNGITGLLGNATEEELVEIFNRMIEVNCTFSVLREMYELTPVASRSKRLNAIMLDQIILKNQYRSISAGMFNIISKRMSFIPLKECFSVQDIIELCKSARKVKMQGCVIRDFCMELLVANIKRILQCLKKSRSDRRQFYEYLQSIRLYWGIALFGNYFKHISGYKNIITTEIDHIIFISSHLQDFCCKRLPLVHRKSPLLKLLSRNINKFLGDAVGTFFTAQQLYEDDKCRANYARILVFGSPFFKKCVSADDVDAFCSSLLADLDNRSIQYICIFFNNVYDEEDRRRVDHEFIMKRCIYANLHKYVPDIDDLASRLNKIGFSFTKTADNKWKYTAHNSQRQKRLKPGVTDKAIDAMIRKVDRYRLLAILREILFALAKKDANARVIPSNSVRGSVRRFVSRFIPRSILRRI